MAQYVSASWPGYVDVTPSRTHYRYYPESGAPPREGLYSIVETIGYTLDELLARGRWVPRIADQLKVAEGL